MNELIVQDHPNYPGLVDLGNCTIHTVHNAFGKGLEKYGKDIDQLCMDLYALFKYSSARREDFKEVQIEMDVEVHNFEHHTEVCWLSIGPSIKRIPEQWDTICHLVCELNKDPKKVPKSINYKKGIHDAWHKGKSSNLSHTRVSKQLHTSIQTVLVTFPEIFTCGSYFI